ncbi:MAG: RpiB/LacA/LacB family sugar-phosphate isomerase [Lentisphaerae bacterium]|jgi:glycine hydroxymethyltransferase|nr:RpiB/LacA/LacB family sugar-phosphate isomerase [Lentisphaerota bacterium]
MKIAIASDHGGVELKSAIVNALSTVATIQDFGPATKESCDYPDYAIPVAAAVAAGEAEFGILICRSGIGMSMTANRFQNVRAAICQTTEVATVTRQHNAANVLCLGANDVSPDYAVEIAKTFIATPVDMDERHARRRFKLERAGRLSDCSGLMHDDPEVFAAIKAQTEQEDTEINLIASENTSSRACREAAGSVLMNKYAEGYPGKRWYSGCLPVDAAEELARKRACELFGADHANVQPHCGSAANMAVYFATIKPGDTIMSLSLDQGGHLSHGSPVNFSGKIYNIVPYLVNKETEMIDYDDLEKQALEVKPKILLSGASAYPRTIDFKRIREICDKVGCIMMVDMAHIAGLVAGGVHPSPVPYADFVTTTTHKTLGGPRGGMVLCKAQYAKALDSAVFPGMQGGPLENIIAAKAVSFREWMQPEKKEYAAQIVKNCKVLCKTVQDRGYRIVSGGTDNHLFLVDVKTTKGITGKEAAAALDAAGIVVNKNTIPYDTESPFRTSGIRVGTASVTTRGMKEPEMIKIGTWICDVLDNIADTSIQERVKAEAKALVAGFPVP